MENCTPKPCFSFSLSEFSEKNPKANLFGEPVIFESNNNLKKYKFLN